MYLFEKPVTNYFLPYQCRECGTHVTGVPEHCKVNDARTKVYSQE